MLKYTEWVFFTLLWYKIWSKQQEFLFSHLSAFGNLFFKLNSQIENVLSEAYFLWYWRTEHILMIGGMNNPSCNYITIAIAREKFNRMSATIKGDNNIISASH